MDKQSISSVEYYKNNTNKIDEYNFANLFNIVKNNEKYYYNLVKTIHFINQDKISTVHYSTYQILETDTWTSLSFKFYNTYKLWWIICKFNDIKNPFEKLSAGTYIKIPTQKLVNNILGAIRSN